MQCTIYELKKMVDRSIETQRDVRLNFVAQIRDLRGTLKKCKDELSCEHMRKEEVEWAFIYKKYQLDQANERIKTLQN